MMKKLLSLFLFVPTLVACGAQSQSSSQEVKEIVVATAGDVPPFVYDNKG